MTARSHPHDLVFTVTVDAAGRVVRVSGELDAATAPSLADAIATLQQQGAGDITVDLARVTLMSAAGVNVVVRAGLDQAAVGAQLVVEQTSPEAARTFDLCGVLADSRH